MSRTSDTVVPLARRHALWQYRGTHTRTHTDGRAARKPLLPFGSAEPILTKWVTRVPTSACAVPAEWRVGVPVHGMGIGNSRNMEEWEHEQQ